MCFTSGVSIITFVELIYWLLRVIYMTAKRAVGIDRVKEIGHDSSRDTGSIGSNGFRVPNQKANSTTLFSIPPIRG